MRLKAKSWMEPMDHQDISEHLVTVAMTNGDDMVIERAPINPIVYLEPPILWLSGPLGMVHVLYFRGNIEFGHSFYNRFYF